MQLLENAVKYSPRDKPLSITAELNGDFVMTSVIDRGSGIDDSEQALIFKKFYRGMDHPTWFKELDWDCLLLARLLRRMEAR